MRNASKAAGLVALLATLCAPATFGGTVRVDVAMDCSRGPRSQPFRAVVTLPSSQETGAIYTVRIDGVSSGTISHTGLNYIHDMTTSYVISSAGALVPGSLRIVPDTGTANVRESARATQGPAGFQLTMPAKIPNGASYTPPSLEFKVKINAPAGSFVALQLAGYRVTANAVVVGDLITTCSPGPKPVSIATTFVTVPKTL